MSESTPTARAARAATGAAERDDHPADRQALQAVQVALDRRDNGGDGAVMLDK